MTESTKSGSVKDIKSEKDSLKLERQKCKVLKQALKEEKKAKEGIDTDLKASLARNEQLQF